MDSYENLGIADVSGYLNIRNSADRNGDVIGMLSQNSACRILGEEGDWYQIESGEILETLDGWYKVRSGSITGYISSDPQFTATGQEAREMALETDGAYLSTRGNNVEVRYALAEAIRFTSLEESTSGGSGQSCSAGQGNSLRTRVANYALQFVGNPYVWGGTSLKRGGLFRIRTVGDEEFWCFPSKNLRGTVESRHNPDFHMELSYSENDPVTRFLVYAGNKGIDL